MQNMDTHNEQKNTPDSVGAEPGAITNHTQGKDTTEQAEMHPVVEKKEGELQCSSSTVQEAAKAYIQRGWYPVPVPYKAKGPRLEELAGPSLGARRSSTLL